MLDLVVLAIAAVPVLAVSLVCAFAVRLTSRGPVLFRQERIGRGAVPFRVVKFRTMLHGDNPLVPDDDRITAVGRVLRRLSLDELPQLLNVLRGDMSIVGPRPTLRYQVERSPASPRSTVATPCRGPNASTSTSTTSPGARCGSTFGSSWPRRGSS